MRSSIRSRLQALVRAQWAGLLALFLVIAGGTAYAADTIGSDDVIDNSLRSADVKNNQIKSVDVQRDSLTGDDIDNGTITGDDTDPQSGIDTCAHFAARFGELCVGSDNVARTWTQALAQCANFEVRLPTIGEALSLAKNYDVPNVSGSEGFWTDEAVAFPNGAIEFDAYIVTDAGTFTSPEPQGNSNKTICVTTPTN